MGTQHTPGPWFTFANGQCVGGPVGPLGNPSGAVSAGICHCGMGLRTGSEVEANARLIAALPALLAAVEDALEFAEDQEDVVDGPDSQPQANKAMQLCATLRDALAQAGISTGATQLSADGGKDISL